MNRTKRWIGGKMVRWLVKRFFYLSIHLAICLSLSVCIYAGEPATITGNKMNILSKGEIMEFIGNVKLVQENLVITANEMKSNEKTGIVAGKGDVAICYSSGSTKTYAWAKTAEYNKNSGNGVVSGDVKVKRVLADDTTNAVNLTCEELEIFEFGERLHTAKNVKIFQKQTEAHGEEAFYNHEIDEILLLGGLPKVTRAEDDGYVECTGDRIYVGNGKETITVLGDVKTKIIMKSKEDLEKEKTMQTDKDRGSGG